MPDNACGCREHGLGLPAFHADAERRTRRGERQVFCEVCGLWRWPEHVGPGAKVLTFAQFARRAKLQAKLERHGTV